MLSIFATEPRIAVHSSFLTDRLQLLLLALHIAWCTVSLGIAIAPSDDDAFYAISAWNLPTRGGTGNASFGTLNDTDKYIASYPAGGAAWIGCFLHTLGPNYFVARLSSLTAAILAALVTARLYSESFRRPLRLAEVAFLCNVYLSLPAVTLTAGVCRLDQLMTATLYSSWLLALTAVSKQRSKDAFFSGLLAGGGLLIHLNSLFAIPTALALILFYPGSAPIARLKLAAFCGIGACLGAVLFYAIHIIPYAARFQLQWAEVMALGQGAPLLTQSLPACMAMEFARWKDFYWGYPYRRFIAEPISAAVSLTTLYRSRPTVVLPIALIALTLLVSLAAGAANKWPWYIAYAAPLATILLSYPFLDAPVGRFSRLASQSAAAFAIGLGLLNHAAWFYRADAWSASRHYPTYRSVIGAGDRMFMRGADTYAFIDHDTATLSHWYFENYEGRARNRRGERLTFFEHMRRNGVTLIIVNNNSRDWLVTQSKKAESERTYSQLTELLASLAPFAPLETENATNFVLRIDYDNPDGVRLMPVASFSRAVPRPWTLLNDRAQSLDSTTE